MPKASKRRNNAGATRQRSAPVATDPGFVEMGHGHLGRTDLTRLRAMTDADIRAQIAADPDVAPEIDESWMADAEVVLPSATKEAVSIRLDAEVINYFRSGGAGYQTRINAVLRRYVAAQEREPSKKNTPARQGAARRRKPSSRAQPRD